MKSQYILILILTFGTWSDLYSQTCQSNSHLSCSVNGTTFLYVNGALVSKKETQLGMRKLQLAIDQRDPSGCILDRKGRASFDYYYNSSSVDNDINAIKSLAASIYASTQGDVPQSWSFAIAYALIKANPVELVLKLIPDIQFRDKFLVDVGIFYSLIARVKSIYETWALVTDTLPNLYRASTNLELERAGLANKTKQTLLESKKVIFVGHGSGNSVIRAAMTDQSLKDLIFRMDYKDIIGHALIGAPTNDAVSLKNKYIRNSLDKVAQFNNIQPFPITLPPMQYETRFYHDLFFFDNQLTQEEIVHIERDMNHSFTETYLFSFSRTPAHNTANSSLFSLAYATVNTVISVPAMLGDHPTCGYCDEGGQQVEASRHVNPGSMSGTGPFEYGGLVSITSIVDPNVYLGKEVKVCGNSSIQGAVSAKGQVEILDSRINVTSGDVEIIGAVVPPEIANEDLFPEPGSEDFNGWPGLMTSINDSVINAAGKILILNSFLVDSSLEGAPTMIHGVANGTKLRDLAAIEGGESDSYKESPDSPIGQIEITGQSIIRGTIYSKTNAIISDSYFDKKSFLLDSATVLEGSYINGQLIGIVESQGGNGVLIQRATVEEKGGVFDSAKVLNEAVVGEFNPSVFVANTNIFRTSVVQNGAAVYDGTDVSGNVLISGSRMLVRRSFIMDNAIVDSEQSSGTNAWGTVESTVVDVNAKVLGTPYVFRSRVSDNATVRDNASVFQSEVLGSSIVLGNGSVRCEKFDEGVRSEEQEFDNCDSVPTLASRSIASAESAKVEDPANENVELNNYLSEATMKLRVTNTNPDNPRSEIAHQKAIKKLEEMMERRSQKGMIAPEQKSMNSAERTSQPILSPEQALLERKQRRKAAFRPVNKEKISRAFKNIK